MMNSCDNQSNDFEQSVSSTQNVFPLSTDDIHFGNFASRQFWALNFVI